MSPPRSEERRIYRIGETIFRVWVVRPTAGAEYFKAGGWIWTPIPSASIMDNPKAERLGPEEFLRYSMALPATEGAGPTRRGMRP